MDYTVSDKVQAAFDDAVGNEKVKRAEEITESILD